MKKIIQSFQQSTMKRTLLLLSTYPFKNPKHGGQIRLSQIEKVYKAAGWNVVSVAVYDPVSYPKVDTGKRDIPFSQKPIWRKFRGRTIPLIDDLLMGFYAVADDGGFAFVRKKLPRHLDAIHVEQPWLWELACKIKKNDKYKDVVLIYGSQNVEAPLKQDILTSFGVDDADEVVNVIKELELKAAQDADLLLAVTKSDLNFLSRKGSKRILHAPNGVEPWEASSEKMAIWREKLPKTPWLLYIASAHPPNFTDFIDLVGDSLACIPPDSRLVIAGTVSEHIYRELAETQWHSLNLSRLELLHILSDEDLAAVKNLAHGFLLPIAHGGGSNIKTAEAIYSGSYIIGTKAAFRGFEHLMHLPEIILAENPIEFRLAIRNVLERPKKSYEHSEVDSDRMSLRWGQCLAEIPSVVDNIVEENCGV